MTSSGPPLRGRSSGRGDGGGRQTLCRETAQCLTDTFTSSPRLRAGFLGCLSMTFWRHGIRANRLRAGVEAAAVLPAWGRRGRQADGSGPPTRGFLGFLAQFRSGRFCGENEEPSGWRSPPTRCSAAASREVLKVEWCVYRWSRPGADGSRPPGRHSRMNEVAPRR